MVTAVQLRYQIRTLFSGWHPAALLWPAGDPEERRILAWLLKRSELFGPPVLMAMVSGILLVQGRVDERWGATPPGFPFVRTFASSLVTSALFSLLVPVFHTRTGSAAAGWAAGLALFFATVTVAQFWCPFDSTYQLWLPFAGISDAGPWPLAASKAAYGLGALGLLWANLGALRRPERLIGRAD